jgi:hypothetical protein
MKRTQHTQRTRTLSRIEKDLRTALHSRTKNVLLIGRLLLGAKELVEPGKWLAWLQTRAGYPEHSQRSVYNYMSAAKYSAKFATVANLRLRPNALYYLAQRDQGEDPIEPKVREAIFAEARKKWLGREEIWDIEARLRPPPKYEIFTHPTGVDEDTIRDALQVVGVGYTKVEFFPADGQIKCLLPKGVTKLQVQAALAEAVADAADTAALLDGESPALPPSLPLAAGSAREQAIDSQFKQAIAMLDQLATKPIDRWIGLLPVEQVARVADMLRVIIARSRRELTSVRPGGSPASRSYNIVAEVERLARGEGAQP